MMSVYEEYLRVVTADLLKSNLNLVVTGTFAFFLISGGGIIAGGYSKEKENEKFKREKGEKMVNT